jgi:ATP-grasp domain, R2K clade family 3
MRVLFPSQPFESMSVDAAFEAERRAAQGAGLETCLINAEALDEGAHEKATRRLPQLEADEVALYRGWMISATSYAALYDALARRRLRLVNDADQYRHCHHLPESYPLIRDHTPKTVWTTGGRAFDLPAVMEALAPFGDAPLIVKDYVKSQKHRWSEACFIPSARDPEAVRRVVTRFIELQEDGLVGGLVFREFVELEPLATHSKSGMPLTKEFRIFFLDGRPLLSVEYWEEGEYRGERPPEDLFLDVAGRVRSRFFTMDVARRLDGSWIIMEPGDAQVAGLPERLDPKSFYQAVAARLR